MKLIARHHLANHLLKCAALMLSVLCWLHINYNKEIQCTIQVPLMLDNVQGNATHAPTSLALHVQGTRSALYAMNPAASAVHVDVSELSQGEHTVFATQDTFFLPDSLSMVDYTPYTLLIH